MNAKAKPTAETGPKSSKAKSPPPSVPELEAMAKVLLEAFEDAPTDEEREAVEDILDRWEIDAAGKLTAIRHVRARLQAEEAFLAEQAKAWAARAKRRTSDIERVEELGRRLALSYQEVSGKPRCETYDGSWVKATVRYSKSLAIDDLTLVPFEFIEIKHVPDKVAIKKRIEAGEAVPGAHIDDNEIPAATWGK